MPTQPTNVEDYLATLPEDRRHALEELRKVIRRNLHKDFEEGIQYGMLGYYLPHSKYPAGYHCDPTEPLPFLSVASQKHHIGLYLFCIYMMAEERERFVEEWKSSGKRLDMGKSCVRAKRLEDIPLDVLGRTVKRIKPKNFVQAYEASLAGTAAGKKHAERKAAATTPGPKAKKTAKKATKKPASRRVTRD